MNLHPFFSYFGSKYRLAKKYPNPLYSTIVEPFAGSAGYSLLHHDKNVILYDVYEPIIQVWNYLIKVQESEILSLPTNYNEKPFTKDNSISLCNIAEEAKILIGFWLTESQSYASSYPLSKSRGGNWTEKKKTLIAKQLKFIRHWKAEVKDYKNIDIEEELTWFIDPPYQDAGKRYKYNKIDYNDLGNWCKNKQGQVIVCEQLGANWLEFSSFYTNSNGSNKKYSEVIWTNALRINSSLTSE